MNIIFSDNAKANSEVRNKNIALLKMDGFTEGGIKCTSGNMVLNELKTKSQLVFGMRCNIAGKPGHGNKYFSLSKDFTNKEVATRYFNNLKNALRVQP